MSTIYCGYDENVAYNAPGLSVWSPTEKYPEYCYGEISEDQNRVYELIREGFHSLNMDVEHYGTKNWNPLGDIIKPGMTVLLKPNWVMHVNRGESGDMSCMVTNPAVIRAVLDYTFIAVGNSGRVIIADAPIQLCDFDALQKTMAYETLWDFYREKGYKFEVLDLRGMVAQKTSDGMKTVRDDMNGITVDLASSSLFSDWNQEKINRLRITNYATHLMKEHHSAGKHEYMINPAVLQADVIINLSKPKSHRKAGMTACAKNLIGICMRKEYLPHHTLGAKEDNGDEYLYRSAIKSIQAKMIDRRNNVACTDNMKLKLLRMEFLALRVLQKLLHSSKPEFSEGSWYGNDTIWRTILDINNIIVYSNSSGQMMTTPQRRIFNICDMIVVGEREGPLLPSPKNIGMIVMGESICTVDYFISKVFGFRLDAIKYLKAMLQNDDFDIENYVVSQGKRQQISEFSFNQAWYIKPASGWVGCLEDKKMGS